ncbi:MAG: DNA polymerase III subunit chi [Sphingobium sp.]
MRVDFYQLSRDPVEQVIPAIAQRLLDDGGRLLVVDGREGALGTLSRSLWAWRENSFLAHGQAGDDDAQAQPILLSVADEPSNGARHIALADGEWRDAALSFDRAFYFFDDGTIDAARQCWRDLKGKDGVTSHFWRQEGRKWVEGP